MTDRSLVAVDDASSGEVVRRQLHDHAVLREDPDVVLAHLAADVGENLVPVVELDPEHGVRQSLDDGALDLDDPFLLRHFLRNLDLSLMDDGEWWRLDGAAGTAGRLDAPLPDVSSRRRSRQPQDARKQTRIRADCQV